MTWFITFKIPDEFCLFNGDILDYENTYIIFVINMFIPGVHIEVIFSYRL